MDWPIRVLLFPLLVGLGCSGGDEVDGLYVLAAQALGPDAHMDKQVVVSPLHDSPGNPRVSKDALALLAKAGFPQMGPEGVEDPENATIYFTPPERLENGLFEIRVHVSLGVRPGRQNRGDSWWRVVADCANECELTEMARLSSFD